MAEEIANEYPHGPKKAICINGHALIDGNIRYRKNGIRNGKQRHIWTCIICVNASNKRNYNPDYYRLPEIIKSRASKRLKNERGRASRYWQIILDHFGAYCHCCGEEERDFLTLEHIKRNGSAHRKSKGSIGSVYMDVINSGFAKDEYTIYCMNCNWSRRRGRKCPHERSILTLVKSA